LVIFFLLLEDQKKFVKIDFSSIAEKKGALYPKNYYYWWFRRLYILEIINIFFFMFLFSFFWRFIHIFFIAFIMHCSVIFYLPMYILLSISQFFYHKTRMLSYFSSLSPNLNILFIVKNISKKLFSTKHNFI